MLWFCDCHYSSSSSCCCIIGFIPSLFACDCTLCTCILFLSQTCLSLLPFTGPVSVRCHPAPETPGNSIGLEAIIRKALMGKYDESEERSPSNAANPIAAAVSAGMPAADGRVEDFFSQGATYSDTSTLSGFFTPI